MASAAAARQAAAPRRRPIEREPVRRARPAPQARRRPVARSRFLRLCIVFCVLFALLAAGRVAMSFAVVQKTVATDAIAREERRLVAENERLQEKLANRGSVVRIRAVAEKRLGLVEPTRVEYLTVAADAVAMADARP